ncbi:zinc finger BED domain-containing protein RICESLEEPER 2-like protein [Tanacetum coccineum]
MIAYFENFQGKVSVTIHAWDTLCTDLKFLVVTCHWIDPGTWKLSKRTICIQGEENVHETVMEYVNDFSLKDKIFSICLDDVGDAMYAKGMEKLKRDLNPMFNGILFETKCVSHVLISMVQTCLDHVDPVIEKARNMLFYVNSLKYDKFQEFLRGKGVKNTGPSLNCPDIWNTTYKMLRGIIAQKALLMEFYASSGENDINDNDWVVIESLLGILKVFHSSTVRLSNAKSPSTPLLLGECLLISDMFRKYKQDPFWKPAITKLQSMFLKYYKTIPPVFPCAAALNPKIGIKGVENILEDIGANLGLSNNMSDSTFAKVSIAKFNSALKEVFDHYDTMHKSRPHDQAHVISTSKNIIFQSVSQKRSDTGTISSDLELYKKTDFSQVMTSDDEETKMLEWWSVKGCHLFPVLAEMVRDLLTVQACVEDLEYAFCFKGRELDEETSMGYPWWLQRRIFLKEHFVEVRWEGNGELVEDLEGECESHNYDRLSDASDEE